MPGYHVVVYVAPMPLRQLGGQVPAYLYFQSSPAHITSAYEVYTQMTPMRFPVLSAVYHGTVGAMHNPVPYHLAGGDYSVYFYFANYQGTVDCYMWTPAYPPNRYVMYEVQDISEPKHWYYGNRI